MTRRLARCVNPSVVALAVGVLVAIQTTSAQRNWPTSDWPTAAPHEVGLDAKVLSALDADIAAGKYGYVDSLLVIRQGRIAFERAYRHDYDRIYQTQARTRSGLNAHHPSGQYNYFNPWWHPFYRRGDLHTLQSVSKTITSVVIGAAVTRKEFPSLDTPVLQFFDPAAVKNVDDRKRRMTLRHLLTMTAGIDWNENVSYDDPSNTTSQMEASFDWVQLAIDRPMSHEPGATYRYNSGATQLLAHVFAAATGKDIEEYANEHLFRPLGITQYFWKRTPTGLADTEGGLYLRPRDLAKIWLLFLRDGEWDGTPIVSSSWVRESTTPAIAVDAQGVRYGYKWWLQPYGTQGRLAWTGSGFGGQFPIAIPEHDLIIVVNAWNIGGSGPAMGRRVAIDRVLAAVRP